jgi:type I restriction-modification system DNA methylase subunit
MSKYDELDARRELEQEIVKDLKQALNKRGFEVKHNGTHDTHALAGKPDIEVWNENTHINVEVTKSTKASQDREWQSIKDHFEETKRNNTRKKCFLWFVSPQTYYRTINSIKDWNFAHENSADQTMMPICFSTFELFIRKLIESPRDEYPPSKILSLFDDFVQFIDDENILRHFYEKLFSNDVKLREEIELKEEERHQWVVEELISGFKQLEQKLRDERIASGANAIKNVIYLVFIKLYEEKKEKEEGQRNRFSLTSFQEYQANIRNDKTAIHQLFKSIKNDEELKKCKLFTSEDQLSERLKDKFVIEHFIKPFEPFAFYTTKVDGLGAAYEVLGQLSGKDVKAGQFFTPENVVKFMVKLTELDPDDKVFDPACGTARFLTHAMDDMVKKVHGLRDESEKIKKIKRTQLFGTDDDPTVAKLAKMNMYIHNDGKTNVKDEDGLTQTDKDGKIDVILTNPPLGDLNYWREIYDDNFRIKRLEIIPKKNITAEKLEKIKKEIEKNKMKLQAQSIFPKKAERIADRIRQLEQDKSDLEYKLRQNDCEYAVTGKQMKGGALFLNACKHYLKDVRNPSEKVEWRGGKVLIILDEGVLNTDDYRKTRDFIRRNFFIKAVISLTRDTFVPVSNTTTKTSILYAVKKEDPDIIQKEPIFFGYADKVGLNTKKKVCENHLFDSGKDLLSRYFEFKAKVMASYEGSRFSEEKFRSQNFKGGIIE